MSDSSTLHLEKINSERINSLDGEIKEIRRDLATLMRELPQITQDAVSQAINQVASNNKSNSNNGNINGSSWSSLAIILTIIFSLCGFFGQQIYFTHSEIEKVDKKTKIIDDTAREQERRIVELQVKFDILNATQKNVLS
ncbi:MAG: hypothetical protein WC860_07070 [Candidatus Margulisiibacteriota bacterium]